MIIIMQMMLNYSEDFEPDIELKHSQVVNHMLSKNKTCEEIIKLLKEICDFQHFYSRNLDKFANSVSKLIVGKDPLKQILIVFERMLATKSQQAENTAISMKDDMIPYLVQKTIDLNKQNNLRARAKDIKDVRNQMTRKLRSLYNAQNNYKKTYKSPKINVIKKEQSVGLTQSYTNLANTIHSYNHSVTNYMQNYSKICQQFGQIEGERINTVRDAMNKYMIFQMNSARSIQYSIVRYMKNLQQSYGGILVQDVSIGASNNGMKLAKISVENYIGELMEEANKNQKDGSNINIQKSISNSHIQFLMSLKKKFKVPQQVSRQQYHEIVQQSFKIMNEAIRVQDLTFVKEFILNYSEGIYSQIQNPKRVLNNQSKQSQRESTIKMKVTLLQGLISHKIFSQHCLWESFSNKIIEDGQKNSKHSKIGYIKQDLVFLKRVNKQQILQNIVLALQLQNQLHNIELDEKHIKKQKIKSQSQKQLKSSKSLTFDQLQSLI